MWLFLDPLVMSFIGLLLIQSMSFLVLWLPFGILTLAQLVRAARSPGKEGLPEPTHTVANIKRWHIAAGCLVACTAVASGIRYVMRADNSAEGILSAIDPDQLIGLALAEATLWLVVGASIFGFFYLGRLQQSGKPYAEFCWFGVSVIPAVLSMLPVIPATRGFEGVIFAGVAGIVAYIVAALMPRGILKLAIWSISCGVIATALSDVFGPWNPVWLFVMIVAGYAVYRMEWKDSLRASTANSDELGTNRLQDSTPRGELTAPVRRTVGFLTVAAVSVSALVLLASNGPVLDGSVPAEFVALISLTIAAIGAAATAVVSAATSLRRSRIDDAAAMFVVLLAAASVIHLIGAPAVEGVMFGTATSSQFWKPVLGSFACLGAAVIAATTLTGKARQVRPFMVAIVIPAAFMLPTAQFFTFEPDNASMAWMQRAIEAGITLAMLSLMWYAFGPGRRREQTQAHRTHREAIVKATAT